MKGELKMNNFVNTVVTIRPVEDYMVKSFIDAIECAIDHVADPDSYSINVIEEEGSNEREIEIVMEHVTEDSVETLNMIIDILITMVDGLKEENVIRI